ncbi:MAG: carboxypeptidase-like regulatory domain-containing protein [Bacteroidota bacterium]
MAQTDSVTISGYVYDKGSGEPVLFCELWLNSQRLQHTTDFNGYFKFRTLKNSLKTNVLIVKSIEFMADTTRLSAVDNKEKIKIYLLRYGITIRYPELTAYQEPLIRGNQPIPEAFNKLGICLRQRPSCDTVDKSFYENHLFSRVSIKIRKHSEKEISFYNSGSIFEFGTTKKGFKIRKWQFFYESEKLRCSGKFKINKRYMRTGSFGSSKRRKKNPKHGRWYYYNESGGLDYMVKYKNGHTKKKIQYDATGKQILKVKSNCFKNWDHDSWTPYHADF